MKRLMSGTVLLGAVLAAGACNNVTSDLSGNATQTPTFLVTDTVQFKSRIVQTFDKAGMPVVGAATVGSVGVIAAAVDPNYRPGGQAVVTKIDVTGNAFGVGSLTTTANGLTTTVNVDVPADNLVGAYMCLCTWGYPFCSPVPGVGTVPSSRSPFVGLTSVAGKHQQVLYISTDSLTMGILAVDTGCGGGLSDQCHPDLRPDHRHLPGGHGHVRPTRDRHPFADDPAAPAGVVATAFSPDSVHLNWTLAGGVNPYQISRGSDDGWPLHCHWLYIEHSAQPVR